MSFKNSPIIVDVNGDEWVTIATREGTDESAAWKALIAKTGGTVEAWIDNRNAVRLSSLKQVTLGSHSVLMAKIDAWSVGSDIPAGRKTIEDASVGQWSVIWTFDESFYRVLFMPYLYHLAEAEPDHRRGLNGPNGDLYAIMKNIIPTPTF